MGHALVSPCGKELFEWCCLGILDNTFYLCPGWIFLGCNESLGLAHGLALLLWARTFTNPNEYTRAGVQNEAILESKKILKQYK